MEMGSLMAPKNVITVRQMLRLLTPVEKLVKTPAVETVLLILI